MKRTVILLLTSILLVGCGGGRRHPENFNLVSPVPSTKKTVVSQEIHLGTALAELEALPTPEGASSASFEELRSALREALLAKGVSKIAAKPPTKGVSDLEIVDIGGKHYALTWSYTNPGDYNQDGIVDIKDITPLAVHFNESANEGNRWIDGNSDGAITIADITPLAASFFNEVAGYSIQGADSLEGTLTEISTMSFSVASGTGQKSFQIDLPESEYYYFAVVPFDSADEPGAISNLVKLSNQTPEARLSATPTSGTLPLTVNFNASGSFDPDGFIVKYQWNFDSDATWDDETSEPLNTHTYTKLQEYRTIVRVTDNRGAWADAGITINVNNLPPVAKLSADPLSGTAPLEVSFDASASSDSDGTIARYEYDWEGDEEYDLILYGDSAPSHTYAAVGKYPATVRVTDNDGATATAKVTIDVNNWPPHAELAANPTEGELPLTVHFNANGSSDSDGTIDWYEWDWEGDGTYDHSSSMPEPVEYTYTSFGTYNATLQVADNDGATTLASILITVPGWAHTWGGLQDEEATAIATDSNSDLYLAGYTWSFDFEVGSRDVLLLKYSPAGGLLWQKTWGGDGDDSAYAVAASDSGVYLVGYTGALDALILKYSFAGELLWKKSWRGGGMDGFWDVAVDTLGNIYLAGYTTSFGAGGSDALILKYDQGGNLLWQKTWGGGSSDSAYKVVVSNSEVYVVGYTRSFGAGGNDSLLLKYDSDGNLLWQKTWGGSGDDLALVLAAGSDKLYVSGYTTSFGAGGSDAFLLEVSYEGEILQETTWGESGDEEISDLAMNANQNLYLTGYTMSFGLGDSELLLLEYASGGTFVRQKTWGKVTNETGWSIIADGNNLYISGSATSNLGEGRNIEGTTSSPAGSVSVPVGTETIPAGTETIPDGTETIPSGIEDAGGGGIDALAIRYGLSE